MVGFYFGDQNMCRSFLLLGLSLFSLNALADASWILTNPQLLVGAKALTKTVKRPLTVYHWTGRNNVAGLPRGPLSSRDALSYEAIQQNMLDRMNRFWETSTPVSGRSYGGGAMAPNGLYFASNPVISRSYGGSNWVMYQAVMPQGMIFIDGRYRGNPAIGPNLTEALAERGCTNPTPEETPVFSARSLIKSDTHQVACRQALIDIAEATEAKAIFYIFKEEPLIIYNLVNKWNTAMVVISPDAFVPF